MRYYIIAGEPSGDLHGSLLMQELKNQDPQAEFRFWGGDKMQQIAGLGPVKHYRELAFMGFVEVILNLSTIFSNIKLAKTDIREYRPDIVIFIDYPGFNLRLAQFVKELGIRTVYYISPQVWAWKSSRVKNIRKYIDLMLVILPFEEEFYQKYNYPVTFVGHPLLDAIEQYNDETEEQFRNKYQLDTRPIAALLAGSRKQEIGVSLPIMQSLVDKFPGYQWVIAGAPGQDPNYYNSLKHPDVRLIGADTYGVLRHAEIALVTSGTATLETALFNVPQIVCYKGNPISYAIGKRLVRNIEFISLVNLIMGKEVVKELIQNEFNAQNIEREFTRLQNEEVKKQILSEYAQLRLKLGEAGAAKRAAKAIVQGTI